MSRHPFRQVDVFGADPYEGNPVAVVLDAAALAQWLLGSGRAAAPYSARQGTALGRRPSSTGCVWSRQRTR